MDRLTKLLIWPLALAAAAVSFAIALDRLKPSAPLVRYEHPSYYTAPPLPAPWPPQGYADPASQAWRPAPHTPSFPADHATPSRYPRRPIYDPAVQPATYWDETLPPPTQEEIAPPQTRQPEAVAGGSIEARLNEPVDLLDEEASLLNPSFGGASGNDDVASPDPHQPKGDNSGATLTALALTPQVAPSGPKVAIEAAKNAPTIAELPPPQSPPAKLTSPQWTVHLKKNLEETGIPLVHRGLSRLNHRQFHIDGTINSADVGSVMLLLDGTPVGTVSTTVEEGAAKFTFANRDLTNGTYSLMFVALNAAGKEFENGRSSAYQMAIRAGKLNVMSVNRDSWSRPNGPYDLQIRFDTDAIPKTVDGWRNKVVLEQLDAAGLPIPTKKLTPQYESTVGGTLVRFKIDTELVPAVYRLRISDLHDDFGNPLSGNDPATNNADYVLDIRREIPSAGPFERIGVAAASGPYVAYPDFVPPRGVPDGFNPEDKVETRVARLYYFRDAHRVAQIVNRTAQSFNRAGADMQRQMADKARREADEITLNRNQQDLRAIAESQKAVSLERELAAKRQSFQTAVASLRDAQTPIPGQPAPPPEVITGLQQVTQSLAGNIEQLEAQIQEARDAESQAKQALQRLQIEEDFAREEQFRREVAAAKEDPDTYAPGILNSDDPVQQVSVSVIGEGLIHLRGPMKGINQIRMMINQIDSPVGQVRVGVHTIQVNGERADRMEIVGQNIQRSIDQARFLTLQSGEILRKSVVNVASRKAEEARGLFPGTTQADRDHRYLYAFFGQDFIDELEAMDSEFLHTGNKILSLHSMDTTSLSSALLLMSLAKNSTRMEIMQEFEMLVQQELPAAEAGYIESGFGCPPDKHKGRHKQPCICYLAQNARFESLRGFYNAEAVADDTITPLQREFIRLAQILKSRLIVELEYHQRVQERAIIEERLGNRMAELQRARDTEEAARRLFDEVDRAIGEQHSTVDSSLAQAVAIVDAIVSPDLFAKRDRLFDDYGDVVEHLNAVHDLDEDEKRAYNDKTGYVRLRGHRILWRYSVNDPAGDLRPVNSSDEEAWTAGFEDALQTAIELTDGVVRGVSLPPEEKKRLDLKLQNLSTLQHGLQQHRATGQASLIPFQLDSTKAIVDAVLAVDGHLKKLAKYREECERLADQVRIALNDQDVEYHAAYSQWIEFREFVARWIDVFAVSQGTKNNLGKQLDATSDGFVQLVVLAGQWENASQRVNRDRRPLDHKKFLDMLIADTEDKYVELLEGTRAQTANIDNYIKRLTTALDDDFNNQFYFPVFREVRKDTTFYDVQFGQTETTTVLANNRGFAKVTPQATMEFDLPQRDIVLAEAMNGAKGMIDEFGALVNDPSFLALSKMNAGSSPATPAPGATGGASVVRNMLPGLPGQTQEQFLAQTGPGRFQFDSPLENLIPDPAIYKFETGTGFEIRPVIQPDGQAVVFGFNYMYTTNVREPVNPNEKHLGRVKRHFVNTDVQLSNFELREVSRYQVALKAARTSRGVPLLEDVPIAGVLFRPLPSDESSLQQNQIYAQATIFPTLFDLMGLRWAPAVADLDPLRLTNDEFIVRGRNRFIRNRVFDHSSEKVDEFLRIPPGTRRPDLYRTQETIPHVHPNGYEGPGLDQRDSTLQEGFSPTRTHPPTPFAPSGDDEGSPLHGRSTSPRPDGLHIEPYPLQRNQRRAAPQHLQNPLGP